MDELPGKVRCLSCAEADCVIALPTAHGPAYRCYHCGPVVRCRFPTDAALPERYIRSYDELTERLRAELIEEDEREPDYEANERRISPQGCVICHGPVSFVFYLHTQEVADSPWCDRCGQLALVTVDPFEPKFRPVRRPRIRLVCSN